MRYVMAQKSDEVRKLSLLPTGKSSHEIYCLKSALQHLLDGVKNIAMIF